MPRRNRSRDLAAGARWLVALVALPLVFGGAPLEARDDGSTPQVRLLTREGRSIPTVRRGWAAEGSGAGGSLVNGGFDDGLSGWEVEEHGGGVAPGDVAAESGGALLTEGDSFLVTIRQSFVVPQGATELTAAVTLEPGFDREDAFIPDAFEVTLLDEAGFPAVSPWTDGATSAFNLQEDGTGHVGAEARWEDGSLSLSLESLAPGDVVTLFFDLIGADGDNASGVLIDGVEISIDLDPGSFRRGDVDGDGTRDTADLEAILAELQGSASVAVDCLGVESSDAADTNDNEFRTIADWLAARAVVDAGSALAAPFETCGGDPDDDTRGFEATEPAYRLAIGELGIEPPVGAEDRDLVVPVLVEAPAAVTGLTAILSFDSSSLRPFGEEDGGFFLPAAGADGFTRQDSGRVVVSAWALQHGATLSPGGAGELVEVGVLRFHIEDFAIVRPFEWLDDLDLGGFLYRSTVVDEGFGDHHPSTASGEHEFVRGNSNNDGRVDLSDSVYTLNYLFLGGPEPNCLDSADANNDSRVDISDGVYSLNFLFLGGPVIPSPYPACGLDVGPVDLLGCRPGSCPE